ncbi:MAG: hypothetical protein ACE5PV_02365 [Candidatus Poribacteria bacterium]
MNFIPFDLDVKEEPRVLLEEPEELMAEYRQPTWSPDGAKVAFKAGVSEIQCWMMENFLNGKTGAR